jgi:CHASE3 domain sensor protein
VARHPHLLDPVERAREKQRSREEDARALASGEKSSEQLQRENGHFSFPNARISLRGTKPLE